jgi:hypothetical protein
VNVPLVRDLRDALCLRLIAECREFESRTGTRVTGLRVVRHDITGAQDTSTRDMLTDVDVEVQL